MNDHARVATPDGIELDFPLAGFASRGLACIVDLILLFGFWAVILLATLGFSNLLEIGDWGGLGLALMVIMAFLSYWGYSIFWELVMRGQTPGKRFLGLRVIRENGLPVGARESALRNLLRVADLQPGATYVVGMIAMLNDDRGRRLGDLVAGTIVVRDSLIGMRSSKAGALWAARAEEGKTQHAVRLPGGSLSARHLSVIEQYLERRSSLSTTRSTEIAARIGGSLRAVLGAELEKLLDKDPDELLQRIQDMANAASEETVTKIEPSRSGSLF